MIYYINKKIIFVFFIMLLLIGSIMYYYNVYPYSISAFIYSAGKNEVYFPAFNVRIDDADKVVALTFDDGPSKEYTTKILDYLEKKGVVATFFVLGDNLKSNNDILIRMVKNGCEIGNHSLNHKQFINLKDDEIKRQINYVDNYVRNATGLSIRAVRTPYGEINERILSAVNRPVILWSIDSEDWKLKDAAKIAQHVLDNVENGSIILLHDIFEYSYNATILIVEELINQGYTFITVSQLLGLDDIRTNGLVFRCK